MPIKNAQNYFKKISQVLNRSIISEPKSLKKFIKLHIDDENNIIGWEILESTTNFCTGDSLNAKESAFWESWKRIYIMHEMKYHFSAKKNAQDQKLKDFRIDNRGGKELHCHKYPENNKHIAPKELGYEITEFNYYSALCFALKYISSSCYPFETKNAELYKKLIYEEAKTCPEEK